MALADIIMAGTIQQGRQANVLAESLSTLGQQVGQQLAMREYQKQAQTVLPALQQTYTSAMDKIQAGNVTEGYRDILNAQLQFGTTQNPFIARMNDMAGGIAEKAANDFLKMKQYEMQYGRAGAGTATKSAAPNLMPFFEGEAEGAGVDFTESVSEMPAGQMEAVEVPLPEQGPVPSAIAVPPQEEEMAMPPVGMPQVKPTPIQKEAKKAAEKYFALSPTRQQQMDKETTYTQEELKDDYDVAPVAGLSRFIPGAVGVGVPKPKERKEKRISITNEGRQTLSIDKKYLDEATTKAKEFAQNLADKVSQLENNPAAMKLITDAGGINRVSAKSDGDIFTLQSIDEKIAPIQIDQETFMAIDTIKGSRAIGASAFMPIVVGRYDFNSVEEAEASGLPSGTIVYIGGRKARID